MRTTWSVLALLLALGLLSLGCSGATPQDDDDDDAGDDDTATTDLVINELCPDNDNVIADELKEYDDWVELANLSGSDFDLEGYGITDGFGEKEPFVFAAGVTVPANGYLLVWCDDESGTTDLHADFKLSADGEEVTLVGPAELVVDQVTFPTMATDVSYARDPDGTGSFVVDKTPTPEASND